MNLCIFMEMLIDYLLFDSSALLLSAMRMTRVGLVDAAASDFARRQLFARHLEHAN